jgi:hypothetical protein
MFWPQTEQEQVDYGDEYSVTLVRSESDSLYDVHHLTVSINNRSKRCSVTLFHYKKWEEGSNPSNVPLIKCLMAVQQEKLKQSTAAQQPTVVACKYVSYNVYMKFSKHDFLRSIFLSEIVTMPANILKEQFILEELWQA